MSNSGRNLTSANRVFPSFGVSRSKNNHHAHNTTGQPGIPNLLHALQQQQSTSNTNNNNTAPPVSQSINKVRVMNVTHHQSGAPGEICLNTEDNLIYYYNGRKWLPLAIGNDQEFQVENGNINIIAHTVPSKTGGSVTITSGMGGFCDGAIHLNIGKENALVIDDKQVTIYDRDLVIKRGDRSIVLPIEQPVAAVMQQQPQPAPEKYELTGDETSVKTDGRKGAIVVNRSIGSDTFYFEMENDYCKGWIQLTAHCEEGGVPHVFLKSLKEGRCEIGVKALEGDLSKVIVYYHLV